MAVRCVITNQIENLSGAISAATYFDANWNNPVNALNDSSLGYVNAIATDAGSANNYVVVCPFGTPSGYNPGMTVAFIAANSNTGASTLTVNPLVAAAILDVTGNPLTGGEIQAGSQITVIYIAGSFRLVNNTDQAPVLNNQVVTVGGTYPINCFSGPLVNIVFDATGAPGSAVFTLALSNVAFGSHIDVLILVAGSGQKFKFTGTDSAGNNITPINLYYGAQGAFNTPLYQQINLISTGDTGNATQMISYQGACFNNSGSPNSQIRFNGFFH
jgi:hypothetical protein